MTPSDAELLTTYAASGNQAAFTALVERHAPLVLSACRRVLGDAHDAEDASQAVFLILARKAGTVETLAPWLHRVAIDVARNLRKTRGIRQRHLSAAAVMSRPEPTNDPGVDDREGLEEEIDGALCQLPEGERSAIVLFHLEGRPLAEVAALVRRPVGTVGVWLHRGRARLGELLRRRGVALSSTAMLVGLSSMVSAQVPAGFVAATTGAAAAFTSGGAAATPATALALKGCHALTLVSAAKSVAVAAALAMVLGAVGFIALAAHSHDPPLGSRAYHPTPERPVGWRGDGTGRFPAAHPPLEWYRQPKGGFTGILAATAKPSASAPAGTALNMGMIRDWLVAGPFPASSHATALTEVTLPDEAHQQAEAGATLGGKPWTVMPVSLTKQGGGNGHLVIDLALAFGQAGRQGDDQHPGTIDPLVAYACSYLYAPGPLDVRLAIQGAKIMAWLNGVEVKIPGQWEVPPVVALKAGWNVLLLKAASSADRWTAAATLVPTATAGYETKNIRWMAAMPGPSWSSPIVVGDRVLVAADGGTLVCLDKADGRVRWTRATTFYDAVSTAERARFPELAAASHELERRMQALPEALNAGLSSDGAAADANQPMQEAIRQKTALEHQIQAAMAKADSKTYACWDNDRGTSTSTPTSDGHYVYAAFWGGTKGVGANAVACFDLDGRRVWSAFTGQTGIGQHGTHSSPALSGGLLVYLSGSTLLAYDKLTGALRWSRREETFGGASVVPLRIAGVDAVLVPQFGIFRTRDGEQLWTSPVPSEKPTPCLVDGTVYGLSEKGIFYVYQLGDGLPTRLVAKPWKSIGLQFGGIYNDLVMASPLVDRGLVYMLSAGGGLSVVEGSTSTLVYSQALESLNPRLTWVAATGVSTGATLAGDVIHIRDDQSQTIVIAPGRRYRELAKNVLWELQSDGRQQEAQSNPFYEEGRIYYRTQGFLYCIGAE